MDVIPLIRTEKYHLKSSGPLGSVGGNTEADGEALASTGSRTSVEVVCKEKSFLLFEDTSSSVGFVCHVNLARIAFLCFIPELHLLFFELWKL